MNEPVCSQKSPYPIDVEEGKTYYYCTCGLSKKQPFCDGQHKDTNFKATAWTAQKTETIFFCGCRKSQKQPLCDGSHDKA